ncbi:hypothetical protein HYDPIDRAFT_117987 [Hydnomerulius pinastri MD-312]|uniref:Wax synthase domain-containing protein n=1 Tax=Hydnomerulius pinastri MD-312 TaxID=994086 RepID=A0A0C9W1T0_9AGAM|nr:hypothetical protein HYDPIDRAFT_117987 [Hydnomerulius pinastri MD-312]
MQEYRYESEEKPIQDAPFLKRWYWSLCVAYGFRGVGWNYRVKNIPKTPRMSRRAFVLVTLLRIFKYAFLLDAAHLWMRYNPVFSSPGASITSQGYILRCANIVAMTLFRMDYASSSITYLALAVITVAAGFYEPRYWPDLFGQWRDAYTIRRFWGHTWHQTMRRWLSNYGKVAARFLGFRPGSQGSSYTQLYVGFILSAFIHTLGDLMISPSLLGTSYWFFISQAIAITVEDGVIAVARRAGVKESALTRAVGYAWVCWWFAYSLPRPFDTMIGYALSSGRLEAVPPTMIESFGGWLGLDVGSALRTLFAGL